MGPLGFASDRSRRDDLSHSRSLAAAGPWRFQGRIRNQGRSPWRGSGPPDSDQIAVDPLSKNMKSLRPTLPITAMSRVLLVALASVSAVFGADEFCTKCGGRVAISGE